MSCVKQFFNAR